jgi:hypothetical protein
VLFDGTGLGRWESTKGGDAGWRVADDYMEVVPGSGGIRTRDTFGDMQLHIEFASPTLVKGESQGRGNSGVFLMGMYEIQVLDNYDNPTYADGTVGAVYGQYPPLANAMRPPGAWNAFDILWRAPVFEGEKVIAPAVVTVLLNNVVLHLGRTVLGKTDHKSDPAYVPHPPIGPVELQDHGDLVRFRNIWVREILDYDT